MRRMLVGIACAALALCLTAQRADAYQAAVVSCNWWQVWEKSVHVEYTNPTLDTVMYVRRVDGNLSRVYASNRYLGPGHWLASFPRGYPDPELVILSASWARAYCA